MEPLPRLGELETAVLEHVWGRGPCDVKAVHRSLGVRRGITLNTVQSAMERLFKKGLLARDKVVVDIPPGQGTAGRVITSDTLDAKGDEKRGLTSARFEGRPKFEERPAGKSGQPKTATATIIDSPSSRRTRPIMFGSLPKRRCQNPWSRMTTLFRPG